MERRNNQNYFNSPGVNWSTKCNGSSLRSLLSSFYPMLTGKGTRWHWQGSSGNLEVRAAHLACTESVLSQSHFGLRVCAPLE